MGEENQEIDYTYVIFLKGEATPVPFQASGWVIWNFF